MRGLLIWFISGLVFIYGIGLLTYILENKLKNI